MVLTILGIIAICVLVFLLVRAIIRAGGLVAYLAIKIVGFVITLAIIIVADGIWCYIASLMPHESPIQIIGFVAGSLLIVYIVNKLYTELTD